MKFGNFSFEVFTEDGFANAINPFLTNVPILYPLKTLNKRRFSGVFKVKWNWNINQKWVKNLPTGKASVSNDISASVMKETIEAYCPKLTQTINDYLKTIFFLLYSKTLKLFPVLKKEISVKKKTIGQFESCQIFQMLLRG